MAVKVNSVGEGIEISWDPMVESGPPEEKPPDQPDGFPTHPIFLPPYVDNSPPTDQPHPDQGLPGAQPKPEHPIFLPPYVDNSLPGGGLGIWGPTDPRPTPPIEIPPDLSEGIDPDKLEKLKSFLLGNLPPYEGAPEYPAPVGGKGGKEIAVQVFGQGQDGDWSNTAIQPNDGLALLRYPKGFTGESYIEVRALDGSLVDSGTIEV